MAADTGHLFTLDCDLKSHELLLSGMNATESLGALFNYQLEILAEGAKEDDYVALEDVLGESMTVRVAMPGGEERFFNGIVSEFSHVGDRDEMGVYAATLKPWLWLLAQTSDCRMFQKMKIPDILEQVFGDRGFSDYRMELSGEYSDWEYCVQYRETDFNFVSRLMEQEGMYYFFEHEENKHVLVIADHSGAHETYPKSADIPCIPPSKRVQQRQDGISEWVYTKRVRPSQFVLQDFNFLTPSAKDLLVNEDGCLPEESYSHSDFEIYDYPGEYPKKDAGDRYVKVRAEESLARHAEVRGGGSARGIAVGYVFNLKDCPREDQNRQYLVVSAVYTFEVGGYTSGVDAGEDAYNVSFSAMDSKVAYRPERTTPKPIVQGLQTAIVAGPSGDEIHTDEHGRVKVQFHWDREGKSDENSSCWIRTAQIWAGKKWGGQFLPRIGQEVIVDFLEGDPDRPIITGRVYNGDQKTPFSLPDNKTQSGIKTHSSLKGTDENCNIIRFEDLKDEEQLYIHAEKNQDIEVENDETHSVGHDRTKTVENDEQSTISNNRTETVGKDETISIGENRQESVGKNETITIGEDRSETVGKSESISIADDRTEDVGGEESISIGKSRSQSVGEDDELSVGEKIVYDAGSEIVLKTGSASITMKANGDITIKGNNLTLKASGKINAKASGAVAIKGSQVKQN